MQEPNSQEDKHTLDCLQQSQIDLIKGHNCQAHCHNMQKSYPMQMTKLRLLLNRQKLETYCRKFITSRTQQKTSLSLQNVRMPNFRANAVMVVIILRCLAHMYSYVYTNFRGITILPNLISQPFKTTMISRSKVVLLSQGWEVQNCLLYIRCQEVRQYFLVRDGTGSKSPPVNNVQEQLQEKCSSRKQKLTDYIPLLF